MLGDTGRGAGERGEVHRCRWLPPLSLQINILRAAINKLVCDGPNGARHLGPERVAQLQDSVRQKLLG